MATTGSSKARLVLRLYVAGSAPNSVRAIANATAICDEHFAAQHTVEPERALADGIIVTPTLLKVSPSPVQRLVGNLSDTQQVVRTLEAR
jgi:circadian clock protein KaiB